MMNWIRKAPTTLLITIVIVCGVGFVVTVGGFVLLEYAGRDTSDYRGIMNMIINAATLMVAGVGAVGGVSAAKSASNAEDQTNGQLDAKNAEIAALRRQLDAARRTGGR